MKKFLFLMLAAILLLPSCAEPVVSAPTWQEQYDLGVRYLSEGNYEEAIIAFTAAIEIDSKRAEAYVGLTNTYIQMEDYEKATETITAGQKNCGKIDIFNNILNELAQYRNQKIDNSEYLDLYEMLQSDNAVSYDDLPALFSAPFNGLEDYLPIVNDGKSMNYYYESKSTGSYSNGNNIWDYDIDTWSCNYDFYNWDDPSRPNISHGNRVMAIAPTGSTNILEVDVRLMRESIDEAGYYGPIGLMDIEFGDSYHTVLTKLGLDANQAESYKEIGIQLYEDGEALGWGKQALTSVYNDMPNAPMIYITFYMHGQDQNGKYVELVFGENSRLNFVRYHNFDLLFSLVSQ